MLDEPEKITATEANRNFSQIFRRAKEGETIIITDRGVDAVMLSPAHRKSAEEIATEATARELARAELFARLRSQAPLNLGKFQRDELYDDVIE